MHRIFFVVHKRKTELNIFYVQDSTHNVFLIMEYCNGGDLADYLTGESNLTCSNNVDCNFDEKTVQLKNYLRKKSE